jgi:flagellar hook capping protein FlgD
VQSFEALSRDAAIELHWRFAYDEPIERIVLYRSAESSSMRPIWERAFDASVRSYVDADVQPGVRYSYELAASTFSGDVYHSPIASATPPALRAYLGQNEPNPFSANTAMTYTLSAPARVAIVVHDATGALVARLDQGARGPGKYTASWDGRDLNHRKVASGVYFYRLEGVARVDPRKMLLLR